MFKKTGKSGEAGRRNPADEFRDFVYAVRFINGIMWEKADTGAG